jgi:hypothetical protein
MERDKAMKRMKERKKGDEGTKGHYSPLNFTGLPH